MARAGLNEAAVVAAATKLINREGLKGLSLTRLAESLGVKPPSLYKHVSGLDGLLHAIALAGIQCLIQELLKATVGKSGDEALIAFMEAFRTFGKENPGLYPLVMQTPQPDMAALLDANKEIREILARVLVPYHLNEPELLHVIRIVRALGHGFISLEAGNGLWLPVDIDESYRLAVRMLLKGLDTGLNNEN